MTAVSAVGQLRTRLCALNCGLRGSVAWTCEDLAARYALRTAMAPIAFEENPGGSVQLEGVDILLLCAVQVEWECLRGLITDPVEDSLLGDPAIRGRFEFDGRSLSVALVEVGMGLASSAMATLGAVGEYRPSLVLFVGIAGGIKDVEIGDVVIADKVYPYEVGKVQDGAFQSRSDTRTVPADLDNIARKLQKSFSPSGYRVFVGALASGEKVVADIASEELRRIRSHARDSLAVEMEGSAVLGAIDRAPLDPDYFLVRGISDLVAGKSETDAEGGQETAIANARDTTEQLIRAWDSTAHASVPVEQTRSDLLAAGLPLPSATETYVLIATPGSAQAAAVVGSGLPLSLVVDLDPKSDAVGLLSRTRPLLESRRAVHLGSPVNPPPFGPNSTAWLGVQGLDDPVTEVRRVSDWHTRVPSSGCRTSPSSTTLPCPAGCGRRGRDCIRHSHTGGVARVAAS